MPYISVQELWRGLNPHGFKQGVFVVLQGYIDESYSGEAVPRMFALTCTISQGSEWSWIEMAWQKCIEEKNASLRQQGRKSIRRYHSADINNFRGDFEGWDGPERQEFCEKLVRVFARHEIGYEGCLINLQELVEEWPATDSDPIAFAYYLLLKVMMLSIGIGITEALPGSKISLFHERCAYDHVFLEAFNECIESPTFHENKCFTTIAPMGWEDCIPLQPADLIAYENFKEGHRQLPGSTRDRRKIFSELLSLDSFAPRLKHVNRVSIVELKKLCDAATKRRRIIVP